MMYQSKLAVAIKVDGRVLREKEDSVFIPFGSEYTIFIKNMNSVRAKVQLEIDGTDATENVQLVVPANGSIEVERFIKGGNINGGQRFKFIERTAAIEDGPRGIKAEDGLIRVQFEFEKVRPPELYLKHTMYNGSAYSMSTVGSNSSFGDVKYKSTSNSTLRSKGLAPSSAASADMYYDGSVTCADMSWADGEQLRSSASVNDRGITVGGSLSDQKFQMTSYFETDGVQHVMILKVFGAVNEVPVRVPVTVKTRVECPTCGTKNKFGTKFCSECGTGLLEV